MGPTEYFESTGWLGEDVWMAHCVHMNDSDIAAFARTKTGVAHCPSSNARLAAGIARVPDMLAAWRPGRPRRRRHGLERVRRTPHRTAQRPPHQPPRRPPGSRPERPSGAAPWHLSAAPRSWAGRRRSVPWSRASSPTSCCGSWTPSRTHRSLSPGDRAGLRRGGPGHALARGRRAGGGERPAPARRRGRHRPRHAGGGAAPRADRRAGLIAVRNLLGP